MTDQVRAAQGAWIRDAGGVAPEQRLREAMSALVRARRLQLLADHGFGGLLAGFGLAAVAVFAARLAQSSVPAWQIAAALVSAALATALVLGWLRRPDSLEVAIRADLALRLKQRLSTAWEIMTVHGDGGLSERLAAQAVRAGLPARAGLVFPLRVNRWGRLVPVALAALLLAAALDVSRIHTPAPRAIDERVVDEGQRLSAFAREMQARSQRDQLPLSERQAEQLERAGARMETGALTRGESLALLRQLAKSLEQGARQALAGSEAKPLPTPPGSGGAARSAAARNARQLLERMLGDSASGADSRALTQYLNELAEAGVPPREAQQALDRYQQGDEQALRDVLEQLVEIERARREHEEMQKARAQVRRAQENLGDAQARGGAQTGSAIDLDLDEGESAERDRERAPSEGDNRLAGESSRGASRYGKQSDSSTAAERQRAPLLEEKDRSGPILKPQGQVRAGEELVTHGQVLPRAGRPNVENVPMAAEFAAQVEEVLSREHYPAHSKELIRKYFLSLSQGAPQRTEAAQ